MPHTCGDDFVDVRWDGHVHLAHSNDGAVRAEVRCAGQQLGEAGVDSLCRWLEDHLPQGGKPPAAWVDLRGAALGDDGVKRLVAGITALHLELERLWLTGNSLTPAAAPSLKKLAASRALKELHLSDNLLDDEAVLGILSSSAEARRRTDGPVWILLERNDIHDPPSVLERLRWAGVSADLAEGNLRGTPAATDTQLSGANAQANQLGNNADSHEGLPVPKAQLLLPGFCEQKEDGSRIATTGQRWAHRLVEALTVLTEAMGAGADDTEEEEDEEDEEKPAAQRTAASHRQVAKGVSLAAKIEEATDSLCPHLVSLFTSPAQEPTDHPAQTETGQAPAELSDNVQEDLDDPALDSPPHSPKGGTDAAEWDPYLACLPEQEDDEQAEVSELSSELPHSEANKPAGHGDTGTCGEAGTGSAVGPALGSEVSSVLTELRGRLSRRGVAMSLQLAPSTGDSYQQDLHATHHKGFTSEPDHAPHSAAGEEPSPVTPDEASAGASACVGAPIFSPGEHQVDGSLGPGHTTLLNINTPAVVGQQSANGCASTWSSQPVHPAPSQQSFNAPHQAGLPISMALAAEPVIVPIQVGMLPASCPVIASGAACAHAFAHVSPSFPPTTPLSTFNSQCMLAMSPQTMVVGAVVSQPSSCIVQCPPCATPIATPVNSPAVMAVETPTPPPPPPLLLSAVPPPPPPPPPGAVPGDAQYAPAPVVMTATGQTLASLAPGLGAAHMPGTAAGRSFTCAGDADPSNWALESTGVRFAGTIPRDQDAIERRRGHDGRAGGGEGPAGGEARGGGGGSLSPEEIRAQRLAAYEALLLGPPSTSRKERSSETRLPEVPGSQAVHREAKRPLEEDDDEEEEEAPWRSMRRRRNNNSAVLA